MNKELRLKLNNTEILMREDSNGRAVISSRDIASVFEKRHDNIIRAIEQLPNDEFYQLNFELSKYTKDLYDGSGTHSYKEYLITRDGFSLLAMGFTGEKAYKWKIAFIDAFNQMEQALKSQSQYSLPKTYKEALVDLIAQVEANEKLQQKIEQDKPKVAFAEAVTNSNHCITITELSRYLQTNGINIGRNKLYEYLRDNGYLIKGGRDKNLPTQQYMEQGLFKVVESVVNHNTYQLVTNQTLVTGRGQQYFLNKLSAYE